MARGNTTANINANFNWPDGDISFLHGIAAIGTKFRKPEVLGPLAQQNLDSGTVTVSVALHIGEPFAGRHVIETLQVLSGGAPNAGF